MSRQGRKVFVVGVGMTKFEKPGKRNWDYPDMAKEAISKALEDSKVSYKEIEQVVVGYVYGDSTCGQRAAYTVGLTGVPVYNVNNNCSTGSTALMIAKQFVEGSINECVLAFGFEKMERGSLTAKWTDRTNPLDQHMETMMRTRGVSQAPFAPQMFGNAGREHMDKYGTTKEQIAKIAYKNHKHSVNNPYSQFRDEYTLEQILKSPQVHDPLTKLQCCPTSEGAAAAILCSEDFVIKHNLQSQAVEILAMTMATDTETSFKDSCIKMVGFDMSKLAADKAYKQAAVTPNDVQVIELHDCFSANELVTYEALGLCAEGKAGQLVDTGAVTYGGKWVVNPSGGLISKGHPLGATGLAQCAELTWQLRGMAGPRQVKGAKIALQHNIGLGGAAVVGIYRLGFPDKFQPFPSDKPNPAVEDLATKGKESNENASGPFKSEAVFAQITKTIASNASLVKQVDAVYQFDITHGPGGKAQSWTVDLKNGNGSVKVGKTEGADLVLTIADEDFVGLMTGQLSSQALYMKGKLKIKGKMALASKLQLLSSSNKAKL